MLKEVKQRQRDILLHGVSQVACAFGHDEMDRAVTKHRHPQQRETCRDKQYASDKLADRSATGDAGDKHTDERRPGEPPAPVEQRPATQPVARLRFIGVKVKGFTHQLGEISAGVLDKGFKQQHRRAKQHHQCQQ